MNLEKQKSKTEQYNRQNDVEVSGISNEVSDQDLEETVIGICKDSEIDKLVKYFRHLGLP